MLWQFILLLILLACSGVVSGSETALFGLSGSDLNVFRQSERPRRRRAGVLMGNPRRVLLTVLMANTAINVLIFAVSTILVAKLGAAHPVLAPLGGVVVLVAVIVVGEVGPKAAALAAPVRLAPLAASVVYGLQTVFQPVRWFLDRLVIEPLLRLLSPPEARSEHLSTDELRSLVMDRFAGLASVQREQWIAEPADRRSARQADPGTKRTRKRKSDVEASVPRVPGSRRVAESKKRRDPLDGLGPDATHGVKVRG